MSAANEYIVAARKFAAQFKGFLAIADELEKVESIEQMVREAQSRLAALSQQEAQAKSAIERLHAAADTQIGERRAAAADEVANMRREAAQIIDEAHQQGGEILKAAREEAAGFANQAEQHRATIADLRAEIQNLKIEIASHEDVKAQALANAVAAQEQHAKERKALRDFRASLPQ